MGEYLAGVLDRVFSAVSDPTRRAILARLAESDARVTDVASAFPISLNSTSKHIRVLESAGLVRRSVRGREHILTLDAAPLAEAAGWIELATNGSRRASSCSKLKAQLEAMNAAWRDWSGDQPGMSAFARDGDEVFHTYSAYARGLDGLWTMWQWLDRAPLGRNEGDLSWFHRHDEYPATAGGPS